MLIGLSYFIWLHCYSLLSTVNICILLTNAMLESNYNSIYFIFYDYFYICIDFIEDQINEWIINDRKIICMLRSCGSWWHVVWYEGTNVSEKYAASNFTFGCLYHKPAIRLHTVTTHRTTISIFTTRKP